MLLENMQCFVVAPKGVILSPCEQYEEQRALARCTVQALFQMVLLAMSMSTPVI